MASMISVVSGGAVVESQQLAVVKNGKFARMSAVKGAHYFLADASAGIAVTDVIVKRSGKNLVLEQNSQGAEQAALVIEGFFGSEGQLFGLGTEGEYLPYAVATELGAAYVSELDDGAASLLGLTVAQSVTTTDTFKFAGGGSTALGTALAGLATLAGGVALMKGKSGSAAPQTASAASTFVLDEGAIAPASSEAPPLVAELESPADQADQTEPDISIADEAILVAEPVALADEDGEAIEETLAAGDIKNKTKPAISLTDGAAKLAAGGVAFSIDDTPVIEGVLDDQGAIQGVVDNGGYTDDGRPQIVGKADSGVLVHVYRGVELIGQVYANENGDWSFTPRLPLANGRHVITILHEYPDGDVSEISAPYFIFVDRSVPDAPVVLGMLDDEGRIIGAITELMVIDDNRPTIDGTAEAHATVIIYDKGKEIGRAKVDADGNWRFTPETPLADGTHILTYSAVDRAGNSSERSAASEFVVDTRPEKINIYYAEDDAGDTMAEVFSGGATDDSTPTLFGSATAGGIVKIYEGSTLLGQVVADVDGTWQFTPPAELSEGAHVFHATVTLVAKGESAPSRPFVLEVDLTPPSVPTIEQVLDDVGSVQGLIANGQSTDDATPTLSGKAEPGSTVHVYDNGSLLGTTVTDSKCVWTYTPVVALAEGEHMFTISATDAAGNTTASPAQYEISIDSTRPDAPAIVSVIDDVGEAQGPLQQGDRTDDTQPTFVGTAEAHSTVIIRDRGVEIGRVQAD